MATSLSCLFVEGPEAKPARYRLWQCNEIFGDDHQLDSEARICLLAIGIMHVICRIFGIEGGDA